MPTWTGTVWSTMSGGPLVVAPGHGDRAVAVEGQPTISIEYCFAVGIIDRCAPAVIGRSLQRPPDDQLVLAIIVYIMDGKDVFEPVPDQLYL